MWLTILKILGIWSLASLVFAAVYAVLMYRHNQLVEQIRLRGIKVREMCVEDRFKVLAG